MGLFNLASHLARPFHKSSAIGGRRSVERICRFEELEPRIALSATPGPALTVGASYYEQSSPESAGDRFQVAFVGGAPNTQLTQLVISGDRNHNGVLDNGDTFFDVDGNPPGAGSFSPFTVTANSDVTAAQITSVSLANGGTDLVLNISNWQAGQTLEFTIDVDQYDTPQNSLVVGSQFQGSTVTASFVTTDGSYQPITAGGIANGQYAEHYTLPPVLNGLVEADTFAEEGEGDPRAGASFAIHQTPNPVTISGTVYHDYNLDGALDNGEQGLSGVQLDLWIKDGANFVSTGQTTTTDANGHYSFTSDDPGTFQVRESQPAGYFSTTPDIVTTANLTPGQSSINNNFGEALPGVLSGHVYEDNNDNGLINGGEAGINNVLVTLTDSNGGTHNGHTDVSGFYQFTNLDPTLTYTLSETQPASYLDGKDTVGTLGDAFTTNDVFHTVAFTHSGDSGSDYNYGEIKPASLTGFIFVDHNRDCEQQEGEPGVAGVKVELWDGSGNPVLDGNNNPIFTLTDANGQFHFDNLDPRLTYQVHEVQPAAYLFEGEHAGTAGGTTLTDTVISDIHLTAGQAADDYHFCMVERPSISGFVFVDHNGDCEQQQGEPGLAGVKIELRDGNGNPVLDANDNPIFTLTDANGHWEFTGLDAGVAYQVHAVQPTAYLFEGEHAGTAGGSTLTDNLISDIQLAGGEHATDYHFCEVERPSIEGHVFVDHNGDCEQQEGEPGLAGVKIELRDGNGNPVLDANNNPIFTLTDANGHWEFTGLDAGVAYQVHAVQPTAYLFEGEHAGTAGGSTLTDNLISDIQLVGGEHATDYHFCEVERPSISGFVFVDSNGDCEQQPGEPGVAGVKIELWDGNGNPVLDANNNPIFTFTDASGHFQFTGLDAGVTYQVHEVQPSGYLFEGEHAGTAGGTTLTANLISDIHLAAGQAADDYHFCLVQPPPPPPPPPPPFNPPPPSPPFDSFAPNQLGPGPGLAPPLAPPGGPASNIVFFGGGSPLDTAAGPNFTFHLSVTDAGRPRGEFQTAAFGTEEAVRNAGLLNFNVFSEEHAQMDGAHWLFAKSPGAPTNVQCVFGSPDGIPVTGDFNGDGVTEVGIYRRGEWFIDVNGNGVWDEGDLYCKLGSEKDLPITGDWDGDGKTDIGVFGPEWATDARAIMAETGLPDRANESPRGAKHNLPPPPEMANAEKRVLKFTAAGKERADVIDHVFYYGKGTDIPVAGDWNGDGVATVGVFNDGTWILDDNGDGRWQPGETLVHFGQAGDIPVVGDWNGDGKTNIGVYRQGTWILDTNGNHVIDSEDRVEHLGGPGDKPVTGDWDGDGKTDIGIYRHGGKVQKADGTIVMPSSPTTR